MARHFTLEEAESVLPLVRERLEMALNAKAGLAQVTADLEATSHRAAINGGILVDRKQVIQWRSRQEALAKRLREMITEIHTFGCQVKDLDTGLLDFPTFYRGEEVLLCWRLGEDKIRYWHGVDEGFRGRKPIDQEFLDGHTGDAQL
jgi:hypothetical protein